MKFEGTDSYVTTRDLTLAVNAANVLQRPLLIKGEPGTGKTLLAEEVARALAMPLFQWHIKSTTKAQQGHREPRVGGKKAETGPPTGSQQTGNLGYGPDESKLYEARRRHSTRKTKPVRVRAKP